MNVPVNKMRNQRNFNYSIFFQGSKKKKKKDTKRTLGILQLRDFKTAPNLDLTIVQVQANLEGAGNVMTLKSRGFRKTLSFLSARTVVIKFTQNGERECVCTNSKASYDAFMVRLGHSDKYPSTPYNKRYAHLNQPVAQTHFKDTDYVIIVRSSDFQKTL